MNCPHLRYKFLFVCMSGGMPYAPELSHIREFCRSARHESCPFCTGKLKKLGPEPGPSVVMTGSAL
jgi:hypothetical protein